MSQPSGEEDGGGGTSFPDLHCVASQDGSENIGGVGGGKEAMNERFWWDVGGPDRSYEYLLSTHTHTLLPYHTAKLMKEKREPNAYENIQIQTWNLCFIFCSLVMVFALVLWYFTMKYNLNLLSSYLHPQNMALSSHIPMEQEQNNCNQIQWSNLAAQNGWLQTWQLVIWLIWRLLRSSL